MVFDNFEGSALHLEEKWLCLDFANTLDWRASAHPKEKLNTYADLIRWGQEKGLIAEAQATELLAEAERRPEAAGDALRQATGLREAIARLLLAHLAGESPEPGDLDLLNRSRAEHASQRLIVPSEGGYAWAWNADPGRLDWILGPISYSAAGLLTSGELARVGMCADETGCGWLFYDTSRNRSRRWCDMQSCGNRAKARQHYGRKKINYQ
jgi:predicted RNA-binding Zn ribbon-like protein